MTKNPPAVRASAEVPPFAPLSERDAHDQANLLGMPVERIQELHRLKASGGLSSAAIASVQSERARLAAESAQLEQAEAAALGVLVRARQKAAEVKRLREALQCGREKLQLCRETSAGAWETAGTFAGDKHYDWKQFPMMVAAALWWDGVVAAIPARCLAPMEAEVAVAEQALREFCAAHNVPDPLADTTPAGA
jgi:hypothetical protein